MELPQITISLSPAPQSEILLVAGGRQPSIEWLRQSAVKRTLWCVDHGVDVCHAANLAPSYLIGDADSASAAAWHWAETCGAISEKFPTEKDFTDTELALQKIKAAHLDAFVLLTGSFGGRFDHAFSLLYSLLGSGLQGGLADEQEMLLLLQGGGAIAGEAHLIPEAISLLPLTPRCTGVTLTGTHWPLENATLRQDQPYAISNRLFAQQQHFSLTLREGCLGLYCCWSNPSANL